MSPDRAATAKLKAKVRFAPSPTGPLHSGNLSTALFTWLRARHLGTQVLLRMDSLDPLRSKQAHVKAILETLDWFPLVYLPEVFHQNPMDDRYREGLNTLIQKEQAYPCFCSRREAYQRDANGNLIYKGQCRKLSTIAGKAKIACGEPHCWRFRDTRDHQTLVDLASGPLHTESKRWGGDFVLWRRDGVPGYHLASVMDDSHLKIEEIQRGRDLIPSSAAQIALFDAFELTVPEFLHVPLLLSKQGEKLSKRLGETRPEKQFPNSQAFSEFWLNHFEVDRSVSKWIDLTETQLFGICRQADRIMD